MSDLLNVDVALERILAEIEPLDAETILLNEARGRVLAVDVVSTENVPPFPASSVDGFGVVMEDVAAASADVPVMLHVVMEVQAGMSPQETLQRGQAARLMTGAPVPVGVTAIIPIEDTDGDWTQTADHVKIFIPAKPNMNIRPVGDNIREGQQIISAGARIRAQEIGVLAAIGQSHVTVFKRPHVVVMSTGDELVNVDEALSPGKIRNSNGLMLEAQLQEIGVQVTRLPIVRDTREAVRHAFETALSHQPDMIISSGGVSLGAVDFVREILDELGSVNFWRVNLKPGKPLAFGKIDRVPFFGLPGNPVSAMVTFDVLARPALLKQAHQPEKSSILREAVLQKSVKYDGRRTYLRVKLEYNEGVLVADPSLNQSSGALLSMVEADGLLILPEDHKEAAEGQVFPVRLLREEE